MNSLTRMPPSTVQQGNWVWDGSNWVCNPDCGDGSGFPPFGPPVFSGPTQQPPWYPGANGGVSFGATFPPNPVRGHMFWDGSVFWLFDGAAWVDIGASGAGGGGGGSASGAGTVVISGTAPGNPETGSQWWDGSVLRMWNGSTWVVIGPGAAAGPVPTTTHTFSMMQASNLTVSSTAWEIVPFSGSPTVDPQLAYNSSTRQIKPTKAGVYMWSFSMPVEGTAGNYVAAILAFNDPGTVDDNTVRYVAVNSVVVSANSEAWLTGTGSILMNGTTDYVRLWAFAGAGVIDGTGSPMLDAFLLP